MNILVLRIGYMDSFVTYSTAMYHN